MTRIWLIDEMRNFRSGAPTKFLDPAEMRRAMVAVAALVRDRGIRAALIGGAAMQTLGSDRMTRDVDFAVESVPPGVPIKKSLSFGGVASEIAGVPTDFVARDDEYRELYEEAVDHAEVVEGVPVRVVIPEHLAAMKMVAGRVKDEEDLRTLIAAEVLALDAARKIIRKHLGRYAVTEFNSFVDEVAWRRSRGDI